MVLMVVGNQHSLDRSLLQEPPDREPLVRGAGIDNGGAESIHDAGRTDAEIEATDPQSLNAFVSDVRWLGSDAPPTVHP